MDKAKYTQATVNGASNGLYPLSTQSLDLIQQQVMLLQHLAKIGGERYILKESTKDTEGIIVIDGEILPLSGERANSTGIRVYERIENITADGDVYVGARVRRSARYDGAYKPNVPNLYPAAGFQTLPTNLSLNLRFSDYTDLANRFATKLTVETYNNLKRSDIDALRAENIRVHCRKGCVVLNGAEEYTINVYRNSDETITQEQLLPDMTRFVRQWDAKDKKWGGFYTPVFKENLHLEVKVTAANKVYVRHGEIPSGVQLVLLRKKKRSGTRRSGGQYTTNKNFIGKVQRRQSKNQYCHYKGVVLTLGEPNNGMCRKWSQSERVAHGQGSLARNSRRYAPSLSKRKTACSGHATPDSRPPTGGLSAARRHRCMSRWLCSLLSPTTVPNRSAARWCRCFTASGGTMLWTRIPANGEPGADGDSPWSENTGNKLWDVHGHPSLSIKKEGLEMLLL